MSSFWAPMFVEKSTLLHQRFKRAILQGRACRVYHSRKGHSLFQRCLERVSCRRRINALRAESLLQGPTVIFIDEGHFFPGLVDFCLRHSKAGHCVCVAALNADYRQRAWDEVACLVHTITALTGVCIVCCGNAYYYSRRIDLEDTDEKYVTTCAAHFDTPLEERHIQVRADLLKKIKV